MPDDKREPEIILFQNIDNWKEWLEKNHKNSDGIWMQIAKKNKEIKSIDYQEGLEVALCYGWIDGQKKSYDDNSWLQKFTPRRAKSIWSKVNKDKVELMIKNGKMQASGLAEIEKAKQNGMWDNAYESQKNITVPEEFKTELDKNEKAKKFFESLNNSNRYSFLFRIHTAKKPETKTKKIKQFIEMLEKGETFH